MVGLTSWTLTRVRIKRNFRKSPRSESRREWSEIKKKKNERKNTTETGYLSDGKGRGNRIDQMIERTVKIHCRSTFMIFRVIINVTRAHLTCQVHIMYTCICEMSSYTRARLLEARSSLNDS